LIGGAISLAMSSLFEGLLLRITYWTPHFHTEIASTKLQEVLWEKAGIIIDIVTAHLFSPVSRVAGIVCVIGILLFAISFVISDERDTRKSSEANNSLQKANHNDES